ncbi:MAG: TolC family protein, partial [Simkaniaceae bacterium]|nr:TolC family protein [Simkaniaceae bacterium]
MKIWILALIVLCSSCTVGPKYEKPEITLENSWSVHPDDEIDLENAPVTMWWTQFEDPLLNKYIASAKEHNNDVLSATANVLEARALRQMAASSFYPQIGSNLSALKSSFSKNGPVFAGAPTGTVSPTTGLPFALQVPKMQTLYNFLFDVSWEIDLFGKTRKTVQVADALIGRV